MYYFIMFIALQTHNLIFTIKRISGEKDRQKEVLILIYLLIIHYHLLLYISIIFLEWFLRQRYIFIKEVWSNTVVNYLVYRIFIC